MCVIPKVFPYDSKIQAMKLTKSKVLEIIRRKNGGWTTYQIKKGFNISIRRINQIYAYYLQNKELPVIGRRMGRPNRPITQEEIAIVKKAYAKYRVSASTLEKLIKRDYDVTISHNRIHKIMITNNLAIPLKKKYTRKKDWIRYERRYSLTAVHIDWYFDAITKIWVLPVIDDASRKMLALVESESATTEASFEAMREKQCERHYYMVR